MIDNDLLDDLVIAVGILIAGSILSLGVRAVLVWLTVRSKRTNTTADDVLLGGLRILVPWTVFIGAIWATLAVLPLGPEADTRINRVLAAAVVLAATMAAARVLTQVIRSVVLNRSGVAGSASIFVNIVRGAVIAIGVLVLLQTLGVSVAPLLTALGVGGLAVALALQDTLANLFAGISILASKKVQPGDFIELDTGDQGYVEDINWRNTSLRQLPNNLVLIPNAKLAGSIVTNYNQPNQPLSVLIDVGVGYGSDLALVERVTCEVGKEIMSEVEGGVPEHDPFIRFHTFGDSSINFSVILRAQEFTNQYLVKHEFIKRLHRRYGDEGIEIPFPIRTVVMPDRSGPVTESR